MASVWERLRGLFATHGYDTEARALTVRDPPPREGDVKVKSSAEAEARSPTNAAAVLRYEAGRWVPDKRSPAPGPAGPREGDVKLDTDAGVAFRYHRGRWVLDPRAPAPVSSAQADDAQRARLAREAAAPLAGGELRDAVFDVHGDFDFCAYTESAVAAAEAAVGAGRVRRHHHPLPSRLEVIESLRAGGVRVPEDHATFPVVLVTPPGASAPNFVGGDAELQQLLAAAGADR